MKALLVGDPHVVGSELDDAKALLKLVVDTAHAHAPDAICFMGDLHHNHRLIDVDVMAFWLDQLQALNQCWRTIAIRGNHDMTGDASNPNHALLAYKRICDVVDSPRYFGSKDAFFAVPYMAKPEDFYRAIDKVSTPNILCHQTFNGAMYENGFYAAGDADAIDPTRYPQLNFISGHIHRPQKFGNVTYIGAPRWRSVADANTKRGLVLVDLDPDKPPEVLTIVDTSKVCRPLWLFTLTEEGGLQAPGWEGEVGPTWGPEFGRIVIDICGSPEFIRKSTPEWKALGARIRTFPTRVEKAQVRESQGIRNALADYLNSFAPIYGTSQDELRELCKQRLAGLP